MPMGGLEVHVPSRFWEQPRRVVKWSIPGASSKQPGGYIATNTAYYKLHRLERLQYCKLQDCKDYQAANLQAYASQPRGPTRGPADYEF